MGLVIADLAQKIKDELVAQYGSPEDADQQEKYAQATAKAVIEYFTANASISCTIPSSSIVTVGGPATQTGPTAPVSISGTMS